MSNSAATVPRNKRKSSKPKRSNLGFKVITRNKFTARKKVKQKKADIPVCECDPVGTEGPLCASDDCINVRMSVECNAEMCPAGTRCANQRFQKEQVIKFEIFDAGKMGRGMRTLQPLRKGEFVMEYVGEVITMDMMHERAEEGGARHHYSMAVGKGECIDPSLMGNFARFVNHSCEPNCGTQKWTVAGEECMGLFALKDIPASTELTFDYQFERVGRKAQRCLCGTPSCIGWIGKKRLKTERDEDGDEYDEDSSEISSQSYNSDSDDLAFLDDDTGAYVPDFEELKMSKQARRRKKKRRVKEDIELDWNIDYTVTIGEMPMLMSHAFANGLEAPSRVFLRRNLARMLAFWSTMLLPRDPKDVKRLWRSRPRGFSARLDAAWRTEASDRRQSVEQLVAATKEAMPTIVESPAAAEAHEELSKPTPMDTASQ